MQKYISGPKLKGIKMVPPGVHMLSCNSVSRQGEFSVTTSFFISLASGQVQSFCGQCILLHTPKHQFQLESQACIFKVDALVTCQLVNQCPS